MTELFVFVFATAVGFVAAGLASSFFQLVTSRRVAFVMPGPHLGKSIAVGAAFAIIGPYIVARGALRAAFIDRRPLVWLAGGLALAAGWSFCSGLILLDLALTVAHGS